ncbi:Dynamin-3 [Manis pentadactyla]|nr:Dynamin-3 [Manis pentadactyla]
MVKSCKEEIKGSEDKLQLSTNCQGPYLRSKSAETGNILEAEQRGSTSHRRQVLGSQGPPQPLPGLGAYGPAPEAGACVVPACTALASTMRLGHRRPLRTLRSRPGESP